MATLEEVIKLAALARIHVSEDKLPKLVSELEAILAYVGQLEELDTGKVEPLLPYGNVMRKDEGANEPGTYTEAITAQFPKREGNYLSVKQILSHD